MALFQKEREDEQNSIQNQGSVAPTLGSTGGGTISGSTGQSQNRNVSGRGSGFTNLQSYIKANEPETGEGNTNARLIRDRASQAQEAQARAQSDFSQKANEIRGGITNTQQVQNLVRSSVQDPTRIAQEQSNVQRIRNLATGKETFQNPTELLNQKEQAVSNLQNQRQNLAQSLQTDTGQGLQDWLRSQRSNPAQATTGESRLDRFIAQSTPSGVSALEQAQNKANQIRALQTPEEAAQLRQMAQGLDSNLVSGENIQNFLNQSFEPEKQFASNLDQNWLAGRLGLDLNQGRDVFNQYQQALNAQRALDEDAIRTTQAIERFNQERFNQERLRQSGELSRLPQWAVENWRIRNDQIQDEMNRLEQSRQSIMARNQQSQERLNQLRANESLGKFNQFQDLSQKSRQDLLNQFDPNRLARIQALAQLSGQDINSILQGRVI